MKDYILKILVNMFKIVSLVTKPNKKMITIIYGGHSGSNLTSVIEKFKDIKYRDFSIMLDYNGDFDNHNNIKQIKSKHKYIETFLLYYYVFRSKLVITTHGFPRLRNDNIMINLWHGIPIKSMALMQKTDTSTKSRLKDDYFVSTSEFYNTTMNACLGITVDKYLLSGYPRNDYLYNQKGLDNINIVLDSNIQSKSKVILYTPTFRDDFIEDLNDGLFGLKNFDSEAFISFLEINDIFLLLKIHPNEEAELQSQFSELLAERVILIKNSDLEINNIDLYQLLNGVDLLVTDYSSIYFDFLLLNRPVIFTPTDIDEYREKRGLVLEPYNIWTPGDKCTTQKSLQKEILDNLRNPGKYEKERIIQTKIFHKYQDGKSTKRVMSVVDDIIGL